MGSFGAAVASLVDTYTKCLTFLKLSSRENQLQGSKARPGSGSELHRALRKARARVRRVYSSKLSHNGSSFERGDAVSRSSVRQVIRALNATVSRLCGSSSRVEEATAAKGGQGLDYASLLSLCESSHTEAIRTMTDLSSRLSGHADSIVHRPSSTKSRASSRLYTSRASHRSHDSHAQGRLSKAKVAYGYSTSSYGRYQKDNRGTSSRRVSGITTSSNSTKLGEIRRRHNPSYGQGSKPAYPRHLQKQPPAKRKKLWGIF